MEGAGFQAWKLVVVLYRGPCSSRYIVLIETDGEKMANKLLFLIPVLLLLPDLVLAIQAGSVVIYSDGSAEKLLAKNAAQSHWEDDRKRRITRSTNPILPVLERTEFLGNRGYSQSVTDGGPDAMPVPVEGNSMAFTVTRISHAGKRSMRNWECTHLGTEDSKVLGKTRRLEHYSCQRFVLKGKYWSRQIIEKKEFSYSPDLGLVVDLKRHRKTTVSSRKLVKILPPAQANYKQVRKALNPYRSEK